MSLRAEMATYLHQVARAGPHRDRNIALVESFYGFGEAAWPTMGALAQRFGVGSRERVRQILNAEFRAGARIEQLTTLQAAARLLSSRGLWIESAFLDELSRLTGAPVETRAPGLLSLLQDLGLACGHELYDAELEKLTRRSYAAASCGFIVEASQAPVLRDRLKAACAVSARLGLAHTTSLRARAGEHHESLKVLLRANPMVWTSGEPGEFWFEAPRGQGALMRLMRKVFAVTERLECAALAAALRNGLLGSARRHGAPDTEAILRWLEDAPGLARHDRQVAYRGAPGELTALEAAVVRRLSDFRWRSYNPLKSELAAQGFEESSIAKLLTRSPLVQVDRSAGPKSYLYRLVGPPRPEWLAEG